MPIARVQLEDGRIAKFEVPEGTTPEQVTQFAQQNQFSQQDPSNEAPPRQHEGLTAWIMGQEDMSASERAKDIGKSALRQAGLAGRNLLTGFEGIVDFAGTPIRAAVQYAGGPDLAGGQSDAADALGLPEAKGAGERIISQGQQMLGAGVPVLGAAQKASSASNIAKTMAAAPGQQVTSMAGAGLAGGAAKEADLGPAGEFAATLAGGMVAPQTLPQSTARTFVKRAREYGYKLPPAMAKGTKTQQFAEGVAGPVPTKQAASVHNQGVTNSLIKRELGYPDDIPLSAEGLDGLRSQMGSVYERAKQAGTITLDATFKKDLNRIASRGSALAKEIPELKQADVVNLVKAFNKKQLSSEAIVDAVKQLRANSSTGFKSADPAIVAQARASGKIANALEKVLERGLKGKNPELVPELKAARQTIAKTYTVENALKGENVDAVALGRMLDKRKPLSGVIRDVAKFGQQFKGAAQTSPPQTTNFRPMDMVAGVGGAAATQQPQYLALMFARPALRKILLSAPYQDRLTKITPTMVDRLMSLPEGVQAKALSDLMEGLTNQESSTPPNSLSPQRQ